MPGAKTLFVLFAESSPDYFKDMLPILEELSRLRVELLSSSPPQDLRPIDSSEEDETTNFGAVGDYANKLIREINNFVSETGTLINGDDEDEGLLTERKQQLSKLEQRAGVAEKGTSNATIKKRL